MFAIQCTPAGHCVAEHGPSFWQWLALGAFIAMLTWSFLVLFFALKWFSRKHLRQQG